MRSATLQRATRETDVTVAIALDGTGEARIATGIGFLDHMLEQIARHGAFDLTIEAKGDLHIDMHHTTEDVGIVRYADALLPMDETLTRVAIDLSGRPFLVFRTRFAAEKIGTFDAQLVREFFQAFAINAGATLHIETLYGENDHHIAESCFKGVARALRAAVALDARLADRIPSTKGSL